MHQEDWTNRIFKTSIELDITLACNLRCLNCDRAIRHAPCGEHMSLEQIQRFVDESRGWKWELLKLIGGEPTMHPEFRQVIEIMERFHSENSLCKIQLWTNGTRVVSVPAWMEVVSSDKHSERHAFSSFNLAPVDLPEYKDLDYSKGCTILGHCGLGLNRHGYYPCAAGSTVDRVFGFDIGGKSLKEYMENEAWKKQLPILCRYCGHFRLQFKKQWTRKEKISASWRIAFDKYEKQRPHLGLY